MAVIAIELFHAAQALDLHDGVKAGKGSQVALEFIRKTVPFVEEDRVLSWDMQKCKDMIADGSLVKAVEAVVGKL